MFPINAVIAEALKVKRKRKLDKGRGDSGLPLLSHSLPPLSLDKAVLQQIRAAVQGEGEEQQKQRVLEELQRQLFLELRSGSFSSRLKSLLLIDFLFTRSPVFRTLACQDLRTIVGCSQCTGLPFVLCEDIRTPPKDYQVEVRDASLRMIEVWDSKFDLPPLRAMARYLRESSGIQMPNVAAELRSQHLLCRQRVQAAAQWHVLCALGLQASLTFSATPTPTAAAGVNNQTSRSAVVVSGSSEGEGEREAEREAEKAGVVASQLKDAEACLQELQECFRVLFPGTGAGSCSDHSSSSERQYSYDRDQYADSAEEEEEEEDCSSDEQVCLPCGEPEEEDEEDVEWEDFDSDSEAGGGCGTTALVTKRAKGYNNHNSDEDNGNAHINAGHDVPNRRADEETKKRSLGEVGGGGVSARRAKTTTTQQQQLDVARSSMPFTMSIDIDVNINAPLSGLNRDNKTGNIILLDTVKELSHQLRTSFLPMLKRWRDLFEDNSALICILGADERPGRDSNSNNNGLGLINGCCLLARQRLQALVEQSEDMLDSKCALLFSSSKS